MQITLNGALMTVEPGMTVAMLVHQFCGANETDPRGIAIERNLEIIPKSAHATTVLEDGDKLEIVQFVGGG